MNKDNNICMNQREQQQDNNVEKKENIRNYSYKAEINFIDICICE